MRFKLNFSLSIAGCICMLFSHCQTTHLDLINQGTIRPIDWRLSEQKSVATPAQILNGQFVPIGDKEPKASIVEDGQNRYKGHMVYKFDCNGQTKRIELSSAFGSMENLKDYSPEEIQELTNINETYINSLHGDYGDIVIYDWYTRFPDTPSTTRGGIIAQLHGRPDRTLVKDPQGNMIKLSVSQMNAMLDTMYFDLHIGKSKATNIPNGWRVDAAAGGPVAEMNYRPPYLYLMVRSSAERMSDSETKVRPVPGKVEVGKEIGKNGKTGFLAFSEPTDQIPIGQWIHFKMEIKYSKYNPVADGVLEKGYIKVWMDDRVLCDIKDVNIGKNDELGPYFKYGIYTPLIGGFSVDHCGFTETIQN